MHAHCKVGNKKMCSCFQLRLFDLFIFFFNTNKSFTGTKVPKSFHFRKINLGQMSIYQNGLHDAGNPKNDKNALTSTQGQI